MSIPMVRSELKKTLQEVQKSYEYRKKRYRNGAWPESLAFYVAELFEMRCRCP